MSEHSPKPWKVSKRVAKFVSDDDAASYHFLACIVDSEDRVVVQMTWCEGDDEEANLEVLRHIVACVNFCARIPTEVIERLLEGGLGAATAMKLLREWEDDGTPGMFCCRHCGDSYSDHVDDCLKPLVEAAKEIE